MEGKEPLVLPRETMLGALADYIATADPGHFQPMNANFGILPPLQEKVRGKKARREAYAARALRIMEDYLASL
jgi:methylenetetrahydrofolate--tRNA-(uracil-5-)-methyltransferase